MNWEAIGAIGEIVGAAAVVVTLIYLAAQMKINTTAINMSATQSVLNGRSEAAKLLAGNSDVANLLWKGADHPDSLTAEEHQRFLFIVSAAVRPIELAFLDYQNQNMDEDTWLGQKSALTYWFTRPGFIKWNSEYGNTLNRKFRELIDQIISESEC